MSKPILVFDMDGVLVDVTESYRETIARTVEHFTKVRPSAEKIQEHKNQGGFNDDWKLSHHMVTALGGNASFEQVKEHFQYLFRGAGEESLMLREKWVARTGTLEGLSRYFQLAVFTGRPLEEARLTLNRFAPELPFEPVIGMYEVQNPKPAPDGLLQILESNPGAKLLYVGDSLDDARSARAAGVPFIGIAAPSNPLYIDLVFLFQEEGAYAIVDDINYLGEVFAS